MVVVILWSGFEGLADRELLRGGFVIGGDALLVIEFRFRKCVPISSYVSD